MHKPGRTTRMMLRALLDLSEGHDVVIVADTQSRAVGIAKRVVSIAKALDIPCRNIRGASPDHPGVLARSHDYVLPHRYVSPRLRMHRDHTAPHERELTPPTRSVEG